MLRQLPSRALPPRFVPVRQESRLEEEKKRLYEVRSRTSGDANSSTAAYLDSGILSLELLVNSVLIHARRWDTAEATDRVIDDVIHGSRVVQLPLQLATKPSMMMSMIPLCV